MDPREDDEPTGTGPGITGASGELIEGTGHDAGIGGTGHDEEAQATGQHPDERTLPSQQDVMERRGGGSGAPGDSPGGARKAGQ